MTSSLTIITDTRSVIVSGDNLVLDLRSGPSSAQVRSAAVSEAGIADVVGTAHDGSATDEIPAINPVANVGEEANGAIAAASDDPASRDADGADRQQSVSSGFTGEDDGRDVEASGGAASVITNSNQRGMNGPALPVEAATEKQAACASRPIDSNSQVLSEPANAGEIDPSQASPAPHSTGATVDKTGRAGEHPSAPVTLSKADMVRLLRPHCQHPGTDLCAGSGRSHCHACRGKSEAAA